MGKYLVGAITAGVLVVVLGVAGFIAAPKNVDYYYISQGGDGSNHTATCVYAHWTWHNDERSFCTDDVQKALEFTAKANASLPGSKR